MSDFDNFIRHPDFKIVLQLAQMLRYLKAELDRPHERSQSFVEVIQQKSHAIDSAVELLRASLCYPSDSNSNSMKRDMCIAADSLIDETIESLTDELRFYFDFKKYRIANRDTCDFIDANQLSCLHDGSDVCKKSNPVAEKFAKWQTDILTDWMIANSDYPFPTQDDILSLSTKAKLTTGQVMNWTTNVRKRNQKATVVKEKKPHHFLDYLFLATAREKQMIEAHPEMSTFMIDNRLTLKTINEYPPLPVSKNNPIQPDEHQPGNNHCRGVSSQKIEKTEDVQIFLRGKGRDSEEAKLLFNLAEQERAKECERRTLQEIVPRGIDNTPAEYSHKDVSQLGLDDVDLRIFDEVTTNLGYFSPGDFIKLEQPKSVSFDGLSEISDDNVEDYVRRLISEI